MFIRLSHCLAVLQSEIIPDSGPDTKGSHCQSSGPGHPRGSQRLIKSENELAIIYRITEGPGNECERPRKRSNIRHKAIFLKWHGFPAPSQVIGWPIQYIHASKMESTSDSNSSLPRSMRFAQRDLKSTDLTCSTIMKPVSLLSFGIGT